MNDELIVTSRWAGDVVRVCSLLNSGADMNVVGGGVSSLLYSLSHRLDIYTCVHACVYLILHTHTHTHTHTYTIEHALSHGLKVNRVKNERNLK